jgi:hypothetical protein
MPALTRGETSDCANPVLDLYVAVDGVLTDVSQLEFQVFERVTGASPVQVYPLSGRETVDIATACPIGEKLGTGHYVASWEVPVTEPIGTHEVRWFFRLLPLSPEQSYTEEFEVLSEAAPSTIGYCYVSDLRAEGVPSTYPDDRLVRAIDLASREIDRLTGRFFEPRALEFYLDGSGGAQMFLEQPIIAVEEIGIDDVTADLLDFAVYNRHLTQNLLDPDDRANPRIVITQPRPETVYWRNVYGRRVFPQGEQNVRVKGVFGFTEYDGTSQGRTPAAIRYAATLLSMRFVEGRWGSQTGEAGSGIVASVRTRDQQITYGNPAQLGRIGAGPLTGDPEIDRILLAHRRPMRLGFV